MLDRYTTTHFGCCINAHKIKTKASCLLPPWCSPKLPAHLRPSAPLFGWLLRRIHSPSEMNSQVLIQQIHKARDCCDIQAMFLQTQ
jgi:hypothetical protein